MEKQRPSLFIKTRSFFEYHLKKSQERLVEELASAHRFTPAEKEKVKKQLEKVVSDEIETPLNDSVIFKKE